MFLDVLVACTWYVHEISLQIYIIAVVHFLHKLNAESVVMNSHPSLGIK